MLLILKASLNHFVLSKNSLKFKIVLKNEIRCQSLNAAQVTEKNPIGLPTGMKDSFEMTNMF